MPEPISAILITLNEKKNLERALPSLSFCDEIIMVDSGSTDGSVEFARALGVQVVERPFDHFGAQKSFAASLAKNDWVFNLDADEWVSPELAAELSQAIQSPDLNGIWIRSRLVFLGRLFRFGRESKVRVLRVFRKSKGDFDRASVHEKVILSQDRTLTTRGAILHYSYPDLSHYFKKMNRYTDLSAQALAPRISTPEILIRMALTPFKFIQFYILQLNFLNGREGFLWASLSTYAYFLKFLKTSRIAKTLKSAI